MSTPTPLSEITSLLHSWYPPHTADDWDAVGLVAGDPEQGVTKVMFAVDVTAEVAAEAAEWGADLLVVHHPLFLKAVHSVAATTPKGRTLATLARAGCALLTAHTNADRAVGGVSESLARALGLEEVEPILNDPGVAISSSRSSCRPTRQRSCERRSPRQAPGRSATTTSRPSPPTGSAASVRSRAPTR
ncbi:MAG: Nif3-like dinuclear metal center hexameric protein [Nocardioides sp.]|uniref:Nif3-like dinuclear metal center hexameric protein n=1 Tax=Nocardioides sp. TaxID=35761 RepID=UPI0023A64CE0|nr:Nif3-like dinuclear metal center hexameric protein [Nocardioides sp.]MDE0778907.1 Nif3-like dinuclear metal center hexameric protein [Nocardioides sp.]